MDTIHKSSETNFLVPIFFFFFFSLTSFLQISESPEYAHWWYRGGPGVPGVRVGVTQQGHTPQDEEAVPNHVCDSHHAV